MNRIAAIAADREPASGARSALSVDCVVQTFAKVRHQTEHLAAPLSPEDQGLQSMEDASPAKWHLAHTTWFFETFVLGKFIPDYNPVDPDYCYLFNSYYDAVGARHPRPKRGMLSRPSSAEVDSYRARVTEAVVGFAADSDPSVWEEAAPLIELGCHHEQQHQELLLMDIQHGLFQNAIDPVYNPAQLVESEPQELRFLDIEGGLLDLGHDTCAPNAPFAFDNEGPRHQAYVAPFRLANRCVTNAEYLAFVEDGGYRQPDHWLADGWARVQTEGWTHPLYWRLEPDSSWTQFTLHGRQPLDPHAPACHLSLYEADAYARWSGKRLPTEQEWEAAAAHVPQQGHFADQGLFIPGCSEAGTGLTNLFGSVWEHTSSAYSPYPGFKICDGAVGEYNGKFMINQWVLRGGACVTPADHIRPTYRNFFYPHQRWMFAGIRLAEDL